MTTVYHDNIKRNNESHQTNKKTYPSNGFNLRSRKFTHQIINTSFGQAGKRRKVSFTNFTVVCFNWKESCSRPYFQSLCKVSLCHSNIFQHIVNWLEKSESNNFRNSECDFRVNALFTCIYEQRLIAFLIKDLKSHDNF